MASFPTRFPRPRARAAGRARERWGQGPDRSAPGDIEAFRVVYKRHGAAALLLACRIVGDPELAADVTHDAFHSLWRSTASYDPEAETVSDWVLRVTRRTAEEALTHQTVGAGQLRPATDPGAA